ncbi:MAG: PIN domain-containing protein [Gemmatimonadetes bacterium]|nr:PIN domain-containing protein [Gemmatimonadota bacterium]
MIAIDTNILVYAHRRDTTQHAEAADVVRRRAESREPWAVPWPCIHEFLAVVTHPRIFRPPSTLAEAVAQVEAWRASPALVLLGEGAGYWPHAREAVSRGRATGPKVHDARVAALCAYHGVRELWSADRDFHRFPGVRVRNPLVG